MTAPMRVSTDDEVYRVRSVYLGPTGYSFPWHARYVAYGVFAVLFAVITVTGLLVGYRHPDVAFWAACFALLGTKAVMQAVDHDVTLRAMVATLRAETHAHRRHRPDPTRYTNAKVDIR